VGIMMSIKNRNKKGAALITVLIIVVIVVTIIANLLVSNYRLLKRVSNRQITEQSTVILYSLVDFVRAVLGTSGATSEIDALTDVWAQPLPETKLLNDVYMKGYIIDEQSKFNINDLVSGGQPNGDMILKFSNLLSFLNLPVSLSYNLSNYITDRQFQNLIVAEYAAHNPPYQPAGRPLIDLSELILVKGFDAAIVNKLKNYVTAISSSNSRIKVNVNTASAEVIAAITNLQLPIAQRFTIYRVQNPFHNQEDIEKFLSDNGIDVKDKTRNNITLDGLDVKSSYFTIHAVLHNRDYLFNWVALVYRADRNGTWPNVLWQHAE
jgi:general secretion pathway protein K